MFTITGYYSPLPNQSFYVTGDYKSEIRLNGKGIAGADGTPVFPGMIAAPKTYTFGTKVCLPKFGCGAVHDRGGAIVHAGERDLARHDRLDLWMGYGEEGLLRALAWGVKHYEGTVYSANAPVKLAVNFEAATPIGQLIDLPEREVFEKNLGRGQTGGFVSELQKALYSLGFYDGDIDGVYDYEVEHSVFLFQKSELLVSRKSDLGAGVFGPQTREKLADRRYGILVEQQIQELWDSFHFDENLNRGKRSTEVLKLQEVLVEQEFLAVTPTGFFGPKTEAALKEFQIAHGIVAHYKSAGAGTVGPQTREKLNEILKEKKEAVITERKSVVAYQKDWNRLTFLSQRSMNISQNLFYGDSGEAVTKLQNKLFELGYLNQQPTGYFGGKTKTALKKYQLDRGIISHSTAKGAGSFGPATQKIFNYQG